VPIIACEDSRRTGMLLSHLGIASPKLVVVNDHTERERAGRLIEDMHQGSNVALVSDAGMPGVSDPGEALVAAVHAAGLSVSVVPGASAVLGALVVSGLPCARFVMEGFLPRKGVARQQRVASIAADERTTVVYESPQRLAATLRDLAAACGPARLAAVVRELTKLHEEIARGSLAELADRFADGTRGEIVLVIGGGPAPEEVTDVTIDNALALERSNGLSNRDAVTAVASGLGVSKNRVYERSLGS
jgi:16S rRNA (cytidine1402-2'-O)-methyltransferase